MSANDTVFSVGSPYVRQIKEASFERGPSGAYDSLVELPGHLELCVDVNGAPWVIARRKAPGLIADMQRVKQQTAGTTPPPEPAPPAA